VEVAERAREVGVLVMPISPLRRQFDGPAGLVFGFAAVGRDETTRGFSVLRRLLLSIT